MKGDVRLGLGPTTDAVLVAEFFQLGFAPGIDKLVSQSCVHIPGVLLRNFGLFLHPKVGKARITTDGGDKFIALVDRLAHQLSTTKVQRDIQLLAAVLGTRACQAIPLDRILLRC